MAQQPMRKLLDEDVEYLQRKDIAKTFWPTEMTSKFES